MISGEFVLVNGFRLFIHSIVGYSVHFNQEDQRYVITLVDVLNNKHHLYYKNYEMVLNFENEINNKIF